MYGNSVPYFDKWDTSHLACKYDDNYYYEPDYKYQFQTEEELVTSDFFQKQLTMALAFKDETIRKLQDELMKPYWARK